MAEPGSLDRTDLYSSHIEQPQESNFSIKDTLIDMGKFAVGMAVVGRLSQVGARGIYKSMVAKNQGLAAKVLSGSRAGDIKSLNMGGLFRGVRQTLATDPGAVFKATTDNGAAMMRGLSKTAAASLEIGKIARNNYATLSKSSSFVARTAASLGKHTYKAAPMAAGFYAINRVLGTEGHKDQPSWYNVPGHLKEVAKLTAEFGVMDTAIGGLKHAAGFAKNLAAKHLSQGRAPGLHNFMDKHFAITRVGDSVKAGGFMQTVMKGAALLDGVREASKKSSTSFMGFLKEKWGDSTARQAQKSNLFDFTDKAYRKQFVNEVKTKFYNGYNSRMKSLTGYRADYGHQGLDVLNDIVASEYKMESGILGQRLERGVSSSELNKTLSPIFSFNGREGERSASQAIAEHFHAKGNHAKATMGSTVLGRSQATVDDMLTTADRKRANSLFDILDESADSTTSGVSMMKDAFFKMKAGPLIYKKAGGGVVDYSMWSPKNVMANVLTYVQPYFNVGFFGKELPLVKTLGMNKYLAGEGLGMHTIRANEGQKYYNKGVDGAPGFIDTVGDATLGDRLGGILVDGELFNMSKEGMLYKANANRQKMVYATPFARESALYKLDAEAASGRTAGALKKSFELQDENARMSMSEKISSFASRWGFKTPAPLQWALDAANKYLGFMPRSVGVNRAVGLLLDPRNTAKSLGGDLNPLLYSVSEMGESASKALTLRMQDPRTLDIMGRISKDVGGIPADRIAGLRKAINGTDDEVMQIIRERAAFETNDQLKYALEHHSKYKNDLGEQISSKFSFRDQNITKKQETLRQLVNDALSGQGLPTTNAPASSINMAKKMLNDSEVLKQFSKEELNHLKLLSNKIDLQHAGYLNGTGNVAMGMDGAAQQKALDIIRTNLKDQHQLLQTNLYDTTMIKDIGTLGFGKSVRDKDTFMNSYTKILERQNRLGKIRPSDQLMFDAEIGPGGVGHAMNTVIDRVMEMGNFFGLRYGTQDRRPYNFKIPELFNKNIFGKQVVIGGGKGVTLGGPLSSLIKRVGQGVGIMAAMNTLDTFADVNPMFNGTILDKGVYSAAADVYVKSSMAFHKVKDLTGVTAAGKYLEGLMPSFTSTIPGAVAGGILRGPLGILPGAVINRFLDAANITPKIDKSYEDMQKIYSGRELVPIRKNRFWAFSKAPYEGDGPSYFRPHWYPRLKSQYKYTDTLYGSKSEAFLYKPWAGLGVNPIGHFLDKYHYEKKHYWDRPYAVTTPAYSEVPIIGKLLGATIGKLPVIGKPLKYMHLDQMSSYYSMDGSNDNPEAPSGGSKMSSISASQQLLHMNTENSPSFKDNHRTGPTRVNPYGAMTVLGEQLYNLTEFAGLRGYQLESLMGGGLADETPRLQGAGDMWSARRAYWDMNLGDVGFSTEFFRRFVPRDKKIWKKVNPLRNKMSSWLPDQEGEYIADFLTGDPYSKIPEGEMRLPGDAYNRLYDVRRTFPGRASSLGKGVENLVRGMTGLNSPMDEDQEEILETGTEMHSYIQDTLLRNNIGYKAEQFVFDAKNDISGHIDLLMYDPIRGGKRALEIKTISGKLFDKLNRGKQEHISQLNFYLGQMQMDMGTLLYINRDDPSQLRTFDVRYNKERMRRDIADVHKARKIAAGIMTKGDGFETGSGYSHLDRMRILADVAPYSNQYKEEAEIVRILIRENKLSERDKEEVAMIKKRRVSAMRKVDLYPTRFRGKIFNPDINYELMSENENIKAAANYSFTERVIGAAWERGMQMDTPLNMKLWNYQSPLQHYKRTKVYGTDAAAWNSPYQDLLKPMFRKALSTDNPVDAAASFGWIGALGLGGMGNMMLPGAAFGAMYGAARTIVGGDEWIPDEVNKKREIERNFDQLKYMKNMHMYDMTGEEQYRTQASNTMWNISKNSYDVSMSQAMKSVSQFEKPYLASWIKETNPIERENILEMVPEEVGNLLRAKWGMTFDVDSPSKYQQMIPNADWEGMMPNDNLEDIKYKTINQEGMRAHDFGMGWFDQQRRVANSQFELNPVTDVSQVSMANTVASRIKSALMRQLGNIARRPLIAVSITPGNSDSVKIQLNLMRDRFQEIREVFRKG